MFSVVTDTSANLDCKLLEKLNIYVVPFVFYVDGKEQTCLDTDGFDGPSFYSAMRSGTRVRTSQVTPHSYIECMEPILQRGEDILFVGMSSGISGSFDSACMAAEQLRGEFPERKICMVDTLSASLGEGILVLRAAEYRDSGMDIETAAEKLGRLRFSMCQIFTVDDLKYLRMTGRLSGLKTIVASVLNIKPLLKGNEEGKIVCFDKVRGRRQSVEALAASYEALVEEPGSQTVGIAHADCPEDAEYLERLLRRSRPPREIMTVCYEPVTGSHVGPGTLALFFLGSEDFRKK